MESTSDAIKKASAAYAIPEEVIAAMIYVESKGNPLAIRYEHNFFLKYIEWLPWQDLLGYKPMEVSRDTELKLRACSLGLMQVMGETAREFGYSEEWLTKLLVDVEANVNLGTKVLSWHLNKNGHDLEKALLAYNGGGNELYPKLVSKAIEERKGVKFLL